VDGTHDASGSRSDTRRGIGIGLNQEELNRGKWIVAVLVTSTLFSLRFSLPHCVPFQAREFRLDKDFVAQAATISWLRGDSPSAKVGITSRAFGSQTPSWCLGGMTRAR